MPTNEMFPAVKPSFARFEMPYSDGSGAEIAVEFRGNQLFILGCGDMYVIEVPREHTRWFLRAVETVLPLVESSNAQ